MWPRKDWVPFTALNKVQKKCKLLLIISRMKWWEKKHYKLRLQSNKYGNCKNRLHPSRVKDNNNEMIWAISFPSLFQISQKEKNLKPDAMITCKWLATTVLYITNYEILSYRNIVTTEIGSHKPCGHCILGQFWWPLNSNGETTLKFWKQCVKLFSLRKKTKVVATGLQADLNIWKLHPSPIMWE